MIFMFKKLRNPFRISYILWFYDNPYVSFLIFFLLLLFHSVDSIMISYFEPVQWGHIRLFLLKDIRKFYYMIQSVVEKKQCIFSLFLSFSLYLYLFSIFILSFCFSVINFIFEKRWPWLNKSEKNVHMKYMEHQLRKFCHYFIDIHWRCINKLQSEPVLQTLLSWPHSAQHILFALFFFFFHSHFCCFFFTFFSVSFNR